MCTCYKCGWEKGKLSEKEIQKGMRRGNCLYRLSIEYLR